MSADARPLFEVRLNLCRRMVEHAKNGTTDEAPGVMLNDVAAYTDPRRLELEMERLFFGLPQVVCLSSDLPEAGSFRVFEDTGVSIIVLRDKEGSVRAFLNTCPHRGARLVRAASGKTHRFTCRFHGWSFDLGAQGMVTQSKHFCGLSEGQKQLVACPAAERHGLVFVRALPGATMDIDAHLGNFGAELAKLDLQGARKVCAGELTVTCNWKYALDTYFENYHFATLHRDSLAPLFPNTMLLYDTWGPHHRLVFPPREAWSWIDKPESEWLIDTIGTPYFIFPNTIVYIGSLRPEQAYVTTFRLYPRGVGETVTRMTTYAPHGIGTPEYRAEVESAFHAMAKLVQDEDYSVTGESWRNLQFMPQGSRLAYGRQELALQHSHRWIARTLGLPEPQMA
jgi:phenylpropionate dioxygenase-like ring-hydroxylating dioxygenase large terminal subunit